MVAILKSIFQYNLLFDFIRRRPWIIVSGIAIVSLVLAVVLRPDAEPERFVSPDETANFFFADRFAQTGKLSAPEPLNAGRPAGVIPVIPRSIAAAGDRLVPTSFLGLPILAGAVGRIAGSEGILLAVPLATAAAVFAAFSFFRAIWGAGFGLASSALFVSLPAVAYYNSRPMMHNLLFVDLLLIGVATTVWAMRRRPILTALGGLAVGSALLVRTSEVAWVGFLLIGAAAVTRSRWRHWLWFVAGVLLVMVILGTMNNSLYGSPLRFGYQTASPETFVDESATLVEQAGNIVFPFGIHPIAASRQVFAYVVKLTPLWAAFGLLGFFRCLVRWRKRTLTLAQQWYVAGLIIVALWLFLAYGSWTIVEHTNASALIVSSSYLRYWLPVFVAFLPFVILGIDAAARLTRHPRTFIVGLLLALVSTSWLLVINDEVAGLRTLQGYVTNAAAAQEIVSRATPDSSLIFVRTGDRVVFPARDVIILPVREPHRIAETIRYYHSKTTLFLLATGNEIAFGKEMDAVVRELGSSLVPVATLPDQGILYRFRWL